MVTSHRQLLAHRAWASSRWFAGWEDSDLAELSRGSEWRDHRRGEPVYRDGQAAELVLLVSGSVWSGLSLGRALTRFGALQEGTLLGTACLQGLDPAPAPWFEYHAAGRVQALAVSAHRVIRLLETQPRLWRGVAREAIVAERQRVRSVCLLQMGTVKERLLSALRQFATGLSSPSTPGPDLELVISQEELGQLIHQSRAHVNRALRELAAEGLIELSYKRIRILDPGRLDELGSMPEPARP